jgi:hypothetical protein
MENVVKSVCLCGVVCVNDIRYENWLHSHPHKVTYGAFSNESFGKKTGATPGQFMFCHEIC